MSMCGRFQLSVKGKEISERFNVKVFEDMFSPNYNCAPSQKLPVITNINPNQVSFFQWGLIPAWAKNSNISHKLINARSESILEKPSFKQAFEQRRCLVPANGFFEWRKSDKIPFRIFLKGEPLFAMAGIWETWFDANKKPLQTFSIITTRANSTVKKIHPRMPVILSKHEEEIWLMSQNNQQLKELLKPVENDKIEFYPISKKINSPRNNASELIYPVNLNDEPTLF